MSTTTKIASVLIPIIKQTGSYEVLFTKRSDDLRHHPGQIGFPGGAYEKHDKSLQETALREAHEEIALPPKDVTMLFDLPIQHTSSDYEVTPWVGMVDSFSSTKLSNEVEQIIIVPLDLLLDVNTYQPNPWTISLNSPHIYRFIWDNHLIWGVTASICHSLCIEKNKLLSYLK